MIACCIADKLKTGRELYVNLSTLKYSVPAGAMEFLEAHPLATRLLRPLARSRLTARLGVLARAYMGATAFDLHSVDLESGRIGIGGVDEIMFGSKFIGVLHEVLGEEMGQEGKTRALFEAGRRCAHWEVSTALYGGRWAPRALVPLIARPGIIDEVRTDPDVARLFNQTMKMVARLISNEGGWGALEIDASSSPITVTLRDSQEVNWVGESDRPVCHFSAGVFSGYTSAISGEELTAREVTCAATGAPACVFEIDR